MPSQTWSLDVQQVAYMYCYRYTDYYVATGIAILQVLPVLLHCYMYCYYFRYY